MAARAAGALRQSRSYFCILAPFRIDSKKGALNALNFKRFYCDKALPPLTTPLNVAKDDFSKAGQVIIPARGGRGEVKITTLSNGLKVASEDSFGQFCTIGALVDAGSRYEVDYPSGVSHMLEKMAFQSTDNFASHDEIVHKMESLGGHVDCQSFKDCIIYAASAFKYNTGEVINVLCDSIWRANMTEDEIEEQKMTIGFELESLDYRPDFEPQLTDLIHAAAFNGNSLGMPKYCPPENISVLNSKILKHYLQRYYTPNRITIAGVNVDHNELVKHCNMQFVDKQPSWLSQAHVEPDRSIAQYTGGFVKEHREEPRLQPGITQFPELVHIAVGFESAKYTDPDMFSFAVLNMLLGGGGSFSAGGPGKGMYSRLYTNVLNRRHWMYSSTAYNFSYADSGLFCIQSSAPPNEADAVVKVIMKEFMNLVTEPFHEIEVARAKKQAQSMLMMNLESRIVRFEDIGRQVLGLGFRHSPQSLYDSLESVTADDLKRVSEKMLSTKPSVAAIGNLTHLPSYKEVEKNLTKSNAGFGRYLFGTMK